MERRDESMVGLDGSMATLAESMVLTDESTEGWGESTAPTAESMAAWAESTAMRAGLKGTTVGAPPKGGRCLDGKAG
jgi:hypothetical protein